MHKDTNTHTNIYLLYTKMCVCLCTHTQIPILTSHTHRLADSYLAALQRVGCGAGQRRKSTISLQ